MAIRRQEPTGWRQIGPQTWQPSQTSPSRSPSSSREWALKAKAMSRQTITLKVSAKGALSVYGMGKWPVTLYAGQWKRLLQPKVVEGIMAYLDEHEEELSQSKD